MNYVYIAMFLVEGFGSQLIGFSSTDAASKCGEFGWAMGENFERNIIPQAET